MKQCSECKQKLNESHFSSRKASVDGLNTSCRKCCIKTITIARIKQEEEDKIEKLKKRAVLFLGREVTAGRIKRPENCSICKKSGRTVGHHEDYAKPYDVMWVCYSCHLKIHRIKGDYNGRGIKVSFETAKKFDVENTEKSQKRSQVNKRHYTECIRKLQSEIMFKDKDREVICNMIEQYKETI